MRNNETDACKICRALSEDKNSPQCEYKQASLYDSHIVLGNACLSKDRALIVLLDRLTKINADMLEQSS